MVHTLTKDDGRNDLTGVTKLQIGGAWDTSTGGSGRILGAIKNFVGTDLDLVAVLMQGEDPVMYAGLDNPDPLETGAVSHSGDEQRGKKSGDDEVISVEFDKIPSHITSVLFAFAAFKKGTNFDQAKNVKVSVYDATGTSTEKVAVIQPSLLATGNFIGIAKAERQGFSWTLEVVNKPGRLTQGDFRSLLRAAIGM
jgi:stress response protein SCP2